MKHFGLVPLRNFACVDYNAGFFRSAQPMYSYEYAWLKNVPRIDVIINLRAESHHDEHAKAHGIEVINVDVKDHHEPTLQQATSFINLVRQLMDEGKRFLIHCEHGHGRTSTFCVLGRIAQGWSLSDALSEEKDRFHYEFKHKAQTEFLRKHFSQQHIRLTDEA